MSKINKLIFWNRLKLVCACNTAIDLIDIPFSLITAKLISNLTIQAIAGKVTVVIKSAILVIILLIVSTIFRICCNTCLRKIQARSKNRCRIDFLKLLFKNPIETLFKTNHGELVENLNDDMNTCMNCFIKSYPSMISSAVATIGYTFFLALENIPVAFSLLAFSLLQLIPPLIVKKFMQVNYDMCRDLEADITNHVMEAVNGFEMIKFYGLKYWWQKKMIDYHKKYLPIGHKTDAIAAAQRSMYRMLDNILKFGTYALMGVYVFLNLCSFEVAVQAIYLSGSIFISVKTFFSCIPEFAVADNAQNRISKWAPTFNYENSENSNIKKIVFKNVNFKYEKRQILVGANVCFNINNNYLIEGENGIGKTTLFHLLMGIELPQKGKVIIGDQNKNTFNYRFPPQTVLYIPQIDPMFGFDAATLFTMFDQEQQTKILELAKHFGLTEKNLHGCDIRELSGGERKKVFLSIGFAIQPQWLLLDEPTNNLDEHGIDVLRELIDSRTGIIIISHNATLRSVVNKVMKIENGCVYNEKQTNK